MSNTKLIDPQSKTEIDKGKEDDFLNDHFCKISSRLGFVLNDNNDYNDDYLNIYCYLDDVFNIHVLSDVPTKEEVLVYAEDIS